MKYKPIKYKNKKLRIDFVEEFRKNSIIKEDAYINITVEKLHSAFPYYSKESLKLFLLDFFQSFIDELLLDNQISFGALFKVKMKPLKTEIVISGEVKKSKRGK